MFSPKSEFGQIEFNDKYAYNPLNDCYIISSKKAKSGWIPLSASVVKGIRKAYVADKTAAEIGIKYAIPVEYISDILNAFDIKHTSLPFTDEELKNKSDATLVKEALDERKWELSQKMEKEKWKQIQNDAVKWMEFESNTLTPFETFLKEWKPPVYQPTAQEPRFKLNTGKRSWVVGAFDWHFGGRAEARYLFKGDNWNIAAANKAIDKLTTGIMGRVANDVVGFEKGVLLLGGDLYNTLTGFTSNGTPLTNEVIKDTQFEAVMNAVLLLTNRMLETFPLVEVHFVRGNHGGTTDIPLAWALKNYYRTEKRLTFDISSCRTKPVRVNNTLILLDHGASDQAKAMMPRDGKAKEAYIQSLFLAHPELLVGVKQRLFCMGDLHHFIQHEYSEFEFIQFGALPCGDQYSDAKNLHNRARQNCLVIDDEGLERVEHIYV